jgi:hypothetical protein
VGAVPSISAVLKAETRAVVRQSLKRLVRRLRKAHRQLRALRDVARDGQRDILRLEGRLAGLQRRARATGQPRRGVGRSLHAVRLRLGMSRARFAELLGVSSGSIFGWESGRTVPRGANQARIQKLQRKYAAGRAPKPSRRRR